MDKLATYRTLIKKLLQAHVDIAARNPSSTRETHLILDEIVLAFHHPSMRPLTEFVVA